MVDPLLQLYSCFSYFVFAIEMLAMASPLGHCQAQQHPHQDKSCVFWTSANFQSICCGFPVHGVQPQHSPQGIFVKDLQAHDHQQPSAQKLFVGWQVKSGTG